MLQLFAHAFAFSLSVILFALLLPGCGSGSPDAQNVQQLPQPMPKNGNPPIAIDQPVRAPAAPDFLHGTWQGEGVVEPARLASVQADLEDDERFRRGETTRCLVTVGIDQTIDELRFTRIEMEMPDDDRLAYFKASVIRSFVRKGKRHVHDPMQFALREAASETTLRYLLRHRKNGTVSTKPLDSSLIDLREHSLMIGEVAGPYRGTHKDGRVTDENARRTLVMSADGDSANGLFILSHYDKANEKVLVDARCNAIKFRRISAEP